MGKDWDAISPSATTSRAKGMVLAARLSVTDAKATASGTAVPLLNTVNRITPSAETFGEAAGMALPQRWEVQPHSRREPPEIAQVVEARHLGVVGRIAVDAVAQQRQRVALYD